MSKFKMRCLSCFSFLLIVFLPSPIFADSPFSEPNKHYIIRENVDLSGYTASSPLKIGEGSVLDFLGGAFIGGYVDLNGCDVSAPRTMIFNDVTFCGKKASCSGKPEWMGCMPGNRNSLCVALAINKLSKGFETIILAPASYYLTSGQTINMDSFSLIGESKKSTIIALKPKDDFVALRFGLKSDGKFTRAWNLTMRNISLLMYNNDAKRTACISIGSTTRCLIDNVQFWNYNDRKVEYNPSSFSNPLEDCNFGMVWDGQTELLTISNYQISGDVALYVKTSFDQSVLQCGYFQCTNFGLACIYGKSFGTNSGIIGRCDCAKGLYGIHFEYDGRDTGRTIIQNLRIEQLRNLTINSKENVGCNIYIKNQGNSDFNVIEDSGLCSSSNGILLDCSTSNQYKVSGLGVELRNVYCHTTNEKHDYLVRIQGDGIVNLVYSNCSLSGYAPVVVPSNYDVVGNKEQPIYGNYQQMNKLTDGYIRPVLQAKSLIYDAISSIDSRNYGLSSVIPDVSSAKSHRLLRSPGSSSNGKYKRGLVAAIVSLTITSEKGDFAEAVYLFKVRNEGFSSCTLLSESGDDLFAGAESTDKLFCSISKDGYGVLNNPTKEISGEMSVSIRYIIK